MKRAATKQAHFVEWADLYFHFVNGWDDVTLNALREQGFNNDEFMFDGMAAFVGETKVKNETDFFGLISALYLVNPLAKFTLTYNGYVYDLNVKWTAANGVKITFNIPPKQTTLKWFEK